MGCSPPASPDLSHQPSSVRLGATLDFLVSSHRPGTKRVAGEGCRQRQYLRPLPYALQRPPAAGAGHSGSSRGKQGTNCLGLGRLPGWSPSPPGVLVSKRKLRVGRTEKTPIKTSAVSLFGRPSFPRRSTSTCGTATTLKPLICGYCFFIHTFI